MSPYIRHNLLTLTQVYKAVKDAPFKDREKFRDVRVYLGDPYEFASTHAVAVTYAPVPSFKKFTKLAAVYPYPWLATPQVGSVRSFTSWRKKI